MARIIDCSMYISNEIWRPRWKTEINTKPGKTVEIEGVKVKPQHSYMHMIVHCVTHIDSPLHVIEGGPVIGEIPI